MKNQVSLIGRLGQDPEVRYTQNGTAVVNFSIATSEYVKGEEKTEWHRIVAFGKTAENCGQYLSRGSMIDVEGKLQTRKWEKDGVIHYTTAVVARWVLFLDRKAKQEGLQDYQYPVEPDGDTPF